MDDATWTVGELARLARVTVRTLHHYDEIGLLCPSVRTDAGYRLYGRRELERLHLIRLYRGVGLPLEEIRALLDDPRFDRIAALRAHRERLVRDLEAAQAVVASLDTLIAGGSMFPKDLFEGFPHEPYEAEARERWGDTDAYRESQRRAKSYDRAAWARIKDEGEAIEAAFAERMQAGDPADGPAAMDVAERHRELITRWFYPCSKAMHAALADMYVQDPRFTAHYEQRATGLAAYVSAAVKANAARP